MKFKKPNQMVKHKLESFATVVALWTLVTLLIKLICMLLKWKYIHGKYYAISIAMTRKRSYFVKKVSSLHMISRTGGQASKYLFATNDVVTRIRIFIMIRSLTGKNLHKQHINSLDGTCNLRFKSLSARFTFSDA